jgi:hypothetical protein
VSVSELRSNGRLCHSLAAMGFYLELLLKSGIVHIQLCATAKAYAVLDARRETRLVVVFTSPSGTHAALGLATRLAVAPSVGIVLLCPVTRGLLGMLRLKRFIRFVRQSVRSWAPSALERLQILAWPGENWHIVVDEFTSSRSILVVHRRWWILRSQGLCGAQVMRANTLSLMLQ